jgi:serine/threonine protein kinase
VTTVGPAAPRVDGFGPLERVGRGGFASVYRAEDVHIGRVVAIKVLEHVDAFDPRSRDRFLRETRAMGRLSGLPHVVDIYQATFTDAGQPCIVMPFFAGGSLEDRLAATGPLPAGSVVAVGVTIARAVDAAHRRGLSHRDIKPGNILIDDRGDVALADFGIAVVEDAAASQRTRTALSPEHAAPERLVTPAEGAPPEAWGDQFSLASTLHMLLTGRPPFGLVAELGLHEVLRRIVEAPAPSTGRDDVPPSLDAALARALAKQPDARYPSASAFADALAATGVSLADPPVSAPADRSVAAAGALAAPGPRPDWRSDRWVDPPPPYVEVSPGAGAVIGERRPAPEARPRSWMTPPDGPAPVLPFAMSPPGPPRAGGETIVPEHRRVDRSAGSGPGSASGSGSEPNPGPSTAVRVLLVGAAVVVVGVALGLGGLALRLGQSPSATATEPSTVPPGPASPPPGPVAPGTTVGPGAAVARPRIDALEPVPGGLHVAWKDDGVADAKGYGYQVTVDGGRPFTGTVDRRDDGSLRLSQEILTLKADGRTERVEPAAHTYCVIVRRLQLGGPVDSDPQCTPPR